MAITIGKLKLYARLGLVVVFIGMAITIGGYRIQARTLKAEAATAREEARQATEAHNRDKVLWQATGLVLTSTATAQTRITRESLERLAEIDEINQECTVIARPEGSIDEETSRKAINMFNNSLFAPLGRLRE